ncbi:MAG: DUF998 domain-containing protein [Dehalococcoidia bacterium]|nr:DUF998 domain-containing protein [Dehalococcoidia bacterium]
MLRESTSGTSASRLHSSRYAALASRLPAKRLVFAGVLMFVLYICMDVIASLAYDDYSYRDQTISELSAIGAPTRTFWVVTGLVRQVLSFAFAFGVLGLAGDRREVRIVGWLLVVFAVSDLLWWFAPMHQREVLAADGGTWQDTLHLVLGGISSLLFFAMIGVGAFAFGRHFRWYSFATLGLMVAFGALMGAETSDVSDNAPTPWLGIWERIAIEGAMLWEAIFAIVLLWFARGPRTTGERTRA